MQVKARALVVSRAGGLEEGSRRMVEPYAGRGVELRQRMMPRICYATCGTEIASGGLRTARALS